MSVPLLRLGGIVAALQGLACIHKDIRQAPPGYGSSASHFLLGAEGYSMSVESHEAEQQEPHDTSPGIDAEQQGHVDAPPATGTQNPLATLSSLSRLHHRAVRNRMWNDQFISVFLVAACRTGTASQSDATGVSNDAVVVFDSVWQSVDLVELIAQSLIVEFQAYAMESGWQVMEVGSHMMELMMREERKRAIQWHQISEHSAITFQDGLPPSLLLVKRVANFLAGSEEILDDQQHAIAEAIAQLIIQTITQKLTGEAVTFEHPSRFQVLISINTRYSDFLSKILNLHIAEVLAVVCQAHAGSSATRIVLTEEQKNFMLKLIEKLRQCLFLYEMLGPGWWSKYLWPLQERVKWGEFNF